MLEALKRSTAPEHSENPEISIHHEATWSERVITAFEQRRRAWLTNVDELPDDLAQLQQPSQFEFQAELLFKVYSPHGNRSIDLANPVFHELGYHEITAGAETKSPTAQWLDGIFRTIIKNEKNRPELQHARIVLLPKGQTPRAFALPDGTICITQSMVNLLESEDEVAAVISHEVDHVLNGTTQESLLAPSDIQGQAVVWKHEMISDSLTPFRLNEADYNTTALITFMGRVGGEGRDEVHQGKTMRQLQIMGVHYGRDFKNSTKELTPIPPEHFHETSYTNIELAMMIAQYGSRAKLQAIARKLHPDDYYLLLDSVGRSDRHKKKAEALDQEAAERLERAGFSADATEFYLWSTHPNLYQALHNQKPLHFLSVIQQVPRWLQDGTLKSMLNTVPRLSLTVNQPSYYLVSSVFNADLGAIDFLWSKNSSTAYSEFTNFFAGLNDLYPQLTQVAPGIQVSDYYRHGNIFRILESFVTQRINGRMNDEKESTRLEVTDVIKKLIDSGWTVSPADINLYLADKSITKYHLTHVISELLAPTEFASITDQADEFIEEYSQADAISDNSPISRLIVKGVSELRTEAEKKEVLQTMLLGLDAAEFEGKFSIQKFLESGWLDTTTSDVTIDAQTQGENNQLFRLQRKLQLLFLVHNTESETFYDLIDLAFEQADIEYDQMSEVALINLCEIFLSDNSYIESYTNTGIFGTSVSKIRGGLTNLPRLLNIPPLQVLQKRYEALHFSSIDEAVQHYQELFPHTLFAKGYQSEPFDVFDTSILAVIIGQPMREFMSHLTTELPDDYILLYERFAVIKRFYMRGPIKDKYLLHISQKIFELPEEESHFRDKIIFLKENYETLGIQGVIHLASQTHTLEEYIQMRRLLGEDVINAALKYQPTDVMYMSADVVSSLQSSDFSELFRTTSTNDSDKKSIMQSLAREWLLLAIGKKETGVRIADLETSHFYKYDPEQRAFVMNPQLRPFFRSFSDAITSLQDQSMIERWAIAAKALADVKGAFATPNNREVLAQTIIQGLNLTTRFEQQLVATACQTLNAEFATFSAAAALGKLLWRALDLSVIDIEELRQTPIVERRVVGDRVEQVTHLLGEYLSEDEVQYLLTASTRELTSIVTFEDTPQNKKALQLLATVDEHYYHVTQVLEQALTQTTPSQEEPTRMLNTQPVSEEMKGVQALIEALQFGGGQQITRNLQRGAQFTHGELRKILENAFDNNPGIIHLIAHENLYQWATVNPELAALAKNLRIGKKEAAGSSSTVFDGEYRDPETGSVTPVVVKFRNPNAKFFIDQGYQAAQDFFEALEKKNRRTFGRFALIGKLVNNISLRWCHADLDDQTYHQDDLYFRTVAEDTNRRVDNAIQIAIPKIIFVSDDLKFEVEEKASGQSLKEFLNDSLYSRDQKLQLMQHIISFYEAQLNMDLYGQVEAEDLEKTIITTSDQNIGNMFVEVLPDNTFKLHLIDRRYYLHLNKRELELRQQFKEEANSKKFLENFVEYVLDAAHIDDATKVKARNHVVAGVWKEAVTRGLRGKEDSLAILQIITEKLWDYKILIPLELLLHLNNISAHEETKIAIENAT